MEQCELHIQLATDIASIKTDIGYIKDSVATHIVEGDKPGGFRDRVIWAEACVKNLEKEIDAVKKSRWIVGIVSGLVGGLSAQATPELIGFLIGMIK